MAKPKTKRRPKPKSVLEEMWASFEVLRSQVAGEALIHFEDSNSLEIDLRKPQAHDYAVGMAYNAQYRIFDQAQDFARIAALESAIHAYAKVYPEAFNEQMKLAADFHRPDRSVGVDAQVRARKPELRLV